MALMINGRCHCGNIEIEFTHSHQDIAVRACSCDFCLMHGGVYTSDPNGSLRINIQDNSLVNKYRFGTGTADFYICSRCGVVPAITSMIGSNLYAVVNVNAFQDIDTSGFAKAITDFEGEATVERLNRRTRNWIPDVMINENDSTPAG